MHMHSGMSFKRKIYEISLNKELSNFVLLKEEKKKSMCDVDDTHSLPFLLYLPFVQNVLPNLEALDPPFKYT